MFKLYLGNRNYSSWSLRGFLIAKLSGEPFDEVDVPLTGMTPNPANLSFSPTGLVPCLHEGDIILQFNGQHVDLSADLPHFVGRAHPGSEAQLVIMRAGKRETLNIVVGELADLDNGQLATAGPGASPVPSRIGVVVEALTDPIQQRAGVDHGVRVVEASGPAAEAGIREGDIVTRLNNQEIDSPATFSKVVDSLTPGRSVPVLIVRGQAPTFLALRVPSE